MSAADVLVLLLCVGLALRSATRLRQIAKAEPAESPRADGAPRSSPHEAAHLTVWPTHPFDRERMVKMLREGGHITEDDARELMGDA